MGILEKNIILIFFKDPIYFRITSLSVYITNNTINQSINQPPDLIDEPRFTLVDIKDLINLHMPYAFDIYNHLAFIEMLQHIYFMNVY